jgi:hypothetical protein
MYRLLVPACGVAAALALRIAWAAVVVAAALTRHLVRFEAQGRRRQGLSADDVVPGVM